MEIFIVGCVPQYRVGGDNYSRPFKYGTPFSYKECITDVKDFLEVFELKQGDVVADVGAGNGYLEGAFSVISDSITFYIEDINKQFLNEEEFGKIVQYYTKLKGRSFTNKNILCRGTRKKTNLPDSLFDKIITNLVFHEIEYPNVMIDDIKNKMKPGGKLFVSDIFSSDRKTRRVGGCNLKAYTVKELIELMNKHSLYLQRMVYPENSCFNILEFVTNVDSAKYYIRINNQVDSLVERLDKFSVSNDSIRTNSITDSILLILKERLDSNKYLSSWIGGIGFGFQNQKKYEAAINIFKANAKLFPHVPAVYDNLGEIYMLTQQYELALSNTKKALELYPYDDRCRSRITRLNQLLKIKN